MQFIFHNCSKYKISNVGIKVYNDYNKMIYSHQSNDGVFSFDLENGIYRIDIYICNTIIDSIVVLSSEDRKIFSYFYCDCNFNIKIKKVYLFDFYYSGLKIERGKILLKSIT